MFSGLLERFVVFFRPLGIYSLRFICEYPIVVMPK
nr:MAG TPA: hypothetical protein [Caudoviricetes sp.]